MDERREEREELAALEREATDDARRIEEEHSLRVGDELLSWTVVTMLDGES